VRQRVRTPEIKPAQDGASRIIPGRQPCREPGCFASFDAGFAEAEEIRHCNRSGPDGGHPHRWDLSTWQLVAEQSMEHDRS
jgi:hypothetical protein